jgi:hypothetical protein
MFARIGAVTDFTAGTLRESANQVGRVAFPATATTDFFAPEILE